MENNSRLTEEQVLEVGPLIDFLEETGPAGYRYLQKLDPALPGLEFTQVNEGGIIHSTMVFTHEGHTIGYLDVEWDTETESEENHAIECEWYGRFDLFKERANIAIEKLEAILMVDILEEVVQIQDSPFENIIRLRDDAEL